MNDLKIGDNVNFVKGRMMYSGKITKFYKNYYNREECSVATEVGTFPHILLQKVAKIKDSSFVDEKDKQIADLEQEIAELKQTQNQKVVEELEKIKKEINLRPVIVRNCGYGDFEEILLEDVYDVIDQQIKLLKGENK